MSMFQDGDKAWLLDKGEIIPVQLRQGGLPDEWFVWDGIDNISPWRFSTRGLQNKVFASLEAASTALRAEALIQQAQVESKIALAKMRKPEGWQ